MVRSDTVVEIMPGADYVSRGGLKLAHALERFGVHPAGRVCADVGASTGGFTDCLLRRGARRVYAIDVGYGQLAWPLRQDPRVVVMDRTNVRLLDHLPEQPDLVVVDVSFISLRSVLPTVIRWAHPIEIVALIKPQFEAGRERLGKGGIVRDPSVHRAVLDEMHTWLRDHALQLLALEASPILGAAGNREFLAHLVPGREREEHHHELVQRALRTADGIACPPTQSGTR
jgi:23S rRNA (cytidine1920-2'-O)/16S rRNA (cytidine1409-2'-O)-methyltransferase